MFKTGQWVYTLSPIYTRDVSLIPEGSFGIIREQYKDGIWLVWFPDHASDAAIEETAMEVDGEYNGT